MDDEPDLFEASVQPLVLILVLPPKDIPPAPASMQTGPVAARAATALSLIVTFPLRNSAENSGALLVETTAFTALAELTGLAGEVNAFVVAVVDCC